MSSALTALTTSIAKRFGMGDGSDLQATLKQTCFKGGTQVTDAQMTALLVVAEQYALNPFTREIYAFPDKGGIVPVVGVDGWARIINEHGAFDGMEFEQTDDACTAIIYRKDRSRPTRVTEYLKECRRDVAPWKSHPKRMLRHKAMIQCARLAFGFGGIYEQDEAEGFAIVATQADGSQVVEPAADAMAPARRAPKPSPAPAPAPVPMADVVEPEQAPAAEQQQAEPEQEQQPAAECVECIGPGELRYLENKVGALLSSGIEQSMIDAMLGRHGLRGISNRITKPQFVALRAEIAKLA